MGLRLGWAAIVAVSWIGLTNPAQAKRPLGDFAQLDFLQDPVISPDGNRIAAKVAINGEQHFALMPLSDRDQKPVLMRLGDVDLGRYQWVNDGWLVASLGAIDALDGRVMCVSRVVAIDAASKKVRRLDWEGSAQTSELIYVPSDGTTRVLVASQKSIYLGEAFYPRVSSVDVATGRGSLVIKSRSGVMKWYADRAGTVRFGVGYSMGLNSGQLLYRDRSGDIFRTIARANYNKNEDLTVPVLIRPGNSVAVVWGKDDAGFQGLYEYDLSNQKRGALIFGQRGYDMDDFEVASDGNGLLGVSWIEDGRQTHWFDSEVADIQANISAAFGKRQARIVSMSRDHSRMIVYVGDATLPGIWYVYTNADGVLRRLAWANEAIKAAPGSPVTPIRYKARDGLEVTAYLTLPKDRPARTLPLIVMPHGGPAARDDLSWNWWAQFLADRGYAVVQPNYRGSSGYGAAFEEKGTGQWGLAMQDDLTDAVTYLAGQGTVDPKRVCIVGGSYGGYAALRGLDKDPDLYRCAVSFAGISDLQAMYNYDGRFLEGKRAKSYWRERTADFDAVSPVFHADRFKAPVLIVHGKKDLRVPVSQSRRMADALQKAGKQVEYVEQPLGDHSLSRQADRVEFLQRLEAFLAAHNPA